MNKPQKKMPRAGGFTERFAKVNGVRLRYLVGGQGSPVVLLHGFAETSHMWRPIMPLLAERHTLVVPDLRGAGGSAKPPSGYDKKNMAVDIHELTTTLNLERVRIVGHDIGLMVAYAYAAQFPEGTERVVLMDGEVVPEVFEVNAFATLHQRQRDLSVEMEVPQVRLYARAYAQPGAMRAGFEYFRNFERDAEDFARLAGTRLSMPMLVLSGEKAGGTFLIEQAKLVASDVRGQVIKGSGHWLIEEAPTTVIPVISDFVA